MEWETGHTGAVGEVSWRLCATRGALADEAAKAAEIETRRFFFIVMLPSSRSPVGAGPSGDNRASLGHQRFVDREHNGESIELCEEIRRRTAVRGGLQL